MANIKKAGVEFLVTIDLGADQTDQADSFTVKYRNNVTGEVVDVVGDNGTATVTELTESAGTYQFPMTIPNPGDYTLLVSSTIAGFTNVASAFVVANASIDDVKAVVDDLLIKLTNVESQVNTLDEATVNNIANQVTAVQSAVNDIKQLINDSSITMAISGDETANLPVGTNITGDTSEATGTITSVSYDSNNDVTNVGVGSVTGTFQVDETVNNGTDSTAGTISVVNASPVDSVLEFVQALDAALKDGATGLSALKGYTDDIENMLSGAANLADGTESPFAGKGLIEIFDSIGVNKTAIDALATQLTDTQTYLENAINTARDAILTDVAAVKAVVDANKAHLEDDGYGLSALKALLDGLSESLSTHDTDIKDILNDATNGLEAIHNTINTRFDAVDASLATIDEKVDDIQASTGSTAQVLI